VWGNLTDTTSMQGTYEFMSPGLVNTLQDPQPYLHSPVDDLESFYYTAQWATAFNDGATGSKHDGKRINNFRSLITSTHRDRVILMVERELATLTIQEEKEYGPFFASSVTLLSPWVKTLSSLRSDWKVLMKQVELLNDEDREKRLGLEFLIYGYRGVKEYFELIYEHRASLQG
jgi:hypothetical protein